MGEGIRNGMDRWRCRHKFDVTIMLPGELKLCNPEDVKRPLVMESCAMDTLHRCRRVRLSMDRRCLFHAGRSWSRSVTYSVLPGDVCGCSTMVRHGISVKSLLERRGHQFVERHHAVMIVFRSDVNLMTNSGQGF
uniref:Uncharacterized protein n=2 Tax=Physcomitrium patens TaxID=3218 RepID=A0A2K1J4A3_PHYPA|nr:hypothetical protein PHYPA_022204 [Physcomitrium patens]